jgi:predicted outer membrane repeat protein
MEDSTLNGIGGPRLSKGRRSKRLLAGALVAASLVGWSASAEAAAYSVYTNSVAGNGAMIKNANDGYCSLAEAVDSVNAGIPQWNCVDNFPGSSGGLIQIFEGPGRPHATNHFRITSLSITAPEAYIIAGAAYIDSTGTSAFVIQSGAFLEINGLTLTFTGTNGGRLIENYGEFAIGNTTLTKGDVTTHPNGLGGAIYNAGEISYWASGVKILNNKAKRGGGIYNKDGEITGMQALISGNSATMAGGGIYNMSTGNNGNVPFGYIIATSTTVTGNSAKAGGGIFNRGEMELWSSSITFNTASGTGSGETCHKLSNQPATSCDGNGGGALVLSFPGRFAAFRVYDSSSKLEDNKASGLGGGIYNTGLFSTFGTSIARNEAKNGGAIYATAVVPGDSNYCDINVSAGQGTKVNSNKTVPAGKYSIVDATNGAVCGFVSTTASGNASPRCGPGSVHPNFVCPQ